MGLEINELAEQLVKQTRVVSNAPFLAPNEPLRVEVIPGALGGSPNLGLSSGTNGLPGGGATLAEQVVALAVVVSYEVQRDEGVEDISGNWVSQWQTLAEDDFVRLPTTHDNAPASDTTNLPGKHDFQRLLSAAFVFFPKIRFTRGELPTDLPEGIPNLDQLGGSDQAGLPRFDHRLLVTITVKDFSYTVNVPFTVPTLRIALPVPPGLCICANGENLTGDHHNLLIAPGSPPQVLQLVQTINQVMDVLRLLKGLVKLVSLLLKPLQIVVDKLNSLPDCWVYTSSVIKDFSDDGGTFGIGEGFDNKLRSFLILAPTGWGIEFNDTANIDDFDDTSDHFFKTYRTIDLLQLPVHVHGPLVLKRLGLSDAEILDLAKVHAQFTRLTGLPADELEIGIGLIFVHDLNDSTLPAQLRQYDNAQEDIYDDPSDSAPSGIESARWVGI